MFVFGQLDKHDPNLRWVGLGMTLGFLVLVTGLWWVQIVSSRDYQSHMERQSFRTVRIPAVRGKILDRDGIVLAENQPVYNASLYLEELRDEFAKEYSHIRPRKVVTNNPPFWKRPFESPTVRTQYVRLNKEETENLKRDARYSIVSNDVFEVCSRLGQPFSLNRTNFERHYYARLALPFPIATNLNERQIAIFQEQFNNPMALELEMQSTRVYPNHNLAAHLLGYVRRDDDSAEGEDAFFSHRLPDFKGQIGIEFGYDKELRGRAGTKSVLVNHAGYRQTESVWAPTEPGRNVISTIEADIQAAAEKALREFSPTKLGAAVVMDIKTGDVLALASCPAYDPNFYVKGLSQEQFNHLYDPETKPALNRATQGGYAPGSIFKTVVGLAALEMGLDPRAYVEVPPEKLIRVGHTPIHDTAPPGKDYDFRKALKLSSNTYFVSNGLRPGVIEKVVELGQRLHLGERTGLPTKQEVGGNFPKPSQIRATDWHDGDTANVSIGQAPIIVTPLQMGVLACALANGGNVLQPRIVDRIEPISPALGQDVIKFPSGVVRDHLGVPDRYMRILHEAMLADVQDADGTGRHSRIEGFPICGKTGTAQVKDLRGNLKRHDVWFLSFAPYGNPKYAVVVMVEGGSSGGGDCAPIAREIYTALIQSERAHAAKASAVARAQVE
jgi:penicillin-binding protein 2